MLPNKGLVGVPLPLLGVEVLLSAPEQDQLHRGGHDDQQAEAGAGEGQSAEDCVEGQTIRGSGCYHREELHSQTRKICPT